MRPTACYVHSEATHPTLKRKRPISDRDFDLGEYVNGKGGVETDWARRYWTFLCCPTMTCERHRHERDARKMCVPNITRPISETTRYHMDAIVVAIDGACRDNGRPYARAGAGVYFHRDNWRWNKAVALEDRYSTSQRAELFACSLALKMVKNIRSNNPKGLAKLRICPGPSRRLRRVVIKADSEYLVKGMTDWIHKWRDNDYENSRGLPVTNADIFKHLDNTVDEVNDMGVRVEFWHVRRGANREADCLANAGLDGIQPQDALDEFFGD